MKNKTSFKLSFAILTAFVICNFTSLQNAYAEKNYSFNDICSSISNNKVTRGDFVLERYAAKITKPLVSHGTYTMSKGDGIIWFTEKPVKSSMAVTTTSLIQVKPSGKRFVLDQSGNKTFLEIAKITSAVFSGDSEIILESFDAEFKQDGDTWSATLLPKNSSMKQFVASINISGNCGDAITISAFEMKIVSGEKSAYKLSNIVYSDILKDNEQSFFKE